MTSVSAALTRAWRRLDSSPSPALDAELLLMHALERPRAWLHAWPEAELDAAVLDEFEELVERRAAGEPIAHLLGRRAFWSFELGITPEVLIPRPETETVVEVALEHIPAPGDGTRVLDLGTGSGCIALALAVERPGARIGACDACGPALEVARRNTARLGPGNIEYRAGEWFEPFAGETFAVIVSNPPYVASDDPHLERGDVRFEPRAALDGGADGLDAIRWIVTVAPAHLDAGGTLVLEHGHDQAEAVASLLRRSGFDEPSLRRDAAGLPRVTYARKA